MLPTIQIKDNFLNQKELEILNNNIDKIQYAPTFNESGNFGFRHNFNESLENIWLFEKIKKIGDRKPKITPNIENLEEFKNFFD